MLPQLSGAFRTNLSLIVVLTIVLVGVLWMQFGGGEHAVSDREKVGGTAVAPSVEAPSRRRPTQPTSANEKIGIARRLWPQLSDADAMNHDPFAAPDARLESSTPDSAEDEGISAVEVARRRDEEEQRLARRKKALATLQKRGMTVFIQGTDGAAVTIGSRVVRAGDVIDGFRVLAITPDGVVLEDTVLH